MAGPISASVLAATPVQISPISNTPTRQHPSTRSQLCNQATALQPPFTAALAHRPSGTADMLFYARSVPGLSADTASTGGPSRLLALERRCVPTRNRTRSRQAPCTSTAERTTDGNSFPSPPGLDGFECSLDASHEPSPPCFLGIIPLPGYLLVLQGAWWAATASAHGLLVL